MLALRNGLTITTRDSLCCTWQRTFQWWRCLQATPLCNAVQENPACPFLKRIYNSVLTKRCVLFGLLISCALYSRSVKWWERNTPGQHKQSLHFFKFCGNFYLFDCLSAFFCSPVWYFSTTWMTNYKATTAIACCDGKKSKTCTICFIYNELSPLPFWCSL